MTLSLLVDNLVTILPLAVLAVWACLLLLVDAFLPRQHKGWIALLAAVGLALAMGIAVARFGFPTEAPFGGMVVVDRFSTFLTVLFLGSGLAGVAVAYDYLKRMEIERGEYYALLLFSICGMMLMGMAADLIVIFLALELLSIPLYILAAMAAHHNESLEAGLKYFLLGAFSGGFLVYGVALVFGATGTTQLFTIVEMVRYGQANLSLLLIGSALIMIGLGFKVGVVPFHMWTPDVYHGAPSPVTAFMSVGAKAGGFAALMRIFVAAFPSLSADMTTVFWVISALTMFLGNVVAIAQSNIKRMLAYSSIAHAGYILMALVPFGQAAVSRVSVASALFYLVAYAFTSFGAWAVVISLEKREGGGLALDDYAGLGRKHPALAAAMTVFMLSFTGVPPTLGFMGKFFLFRSIMEGGFVGLALIGVLTSLISAYFYLRVVVVMYMREGEPEVTSEPWLQLTVFVSAIAVVVLSLFSTPLLDWASRAVLQLF